MASSWGDGHNAKEMHITQHKEKSASIDAGDWIINTMYNDGSCWTYQGLVLMAIAWGSAQAILQCRRHSIRKWKSTGKG